MLIVYDYYIQNSGSLGGMLFDPLKEATNGVDKLYYTKYFYNYFYRWIYDNLFMVFIRTILLTMVMGIIIDKFGELKDAALEKFCF